MRQILFRGKRVDNGRWIFGYYFQKQNPLSADGLPISHHISDIPPFGAEVDPETIGQFTGLYDKNGKKIFEGDVVDVAYDIQYVGVAAERIGLFEVVFYDGCFMKKKRSGGLFHFIPSDKCQVIGTIYDNPELLEDKQ